jgi:DNA-binding SARP family transcriptional activator
MPAAALPVSPVLSVLGGFELTAGESPASLCSAAQRLLGYLAVHGRGRPVARTALAERLWDDNEPERAAGRLRSALWRLPKPGGRQLVSCTPTTVRLAPSVAVDLWEAEDQARGLRQADAPARPEMFVGDLLPDWTEDWLVVERESFRQIRLHALERTSARQCELGNYAAALAAALAAVRCEPLRESAQRQVISVHLAEGNHAEALRQYQSFRRLLAAELGLPPTPAIRTLVAPLLGRPIERAAALRDRQ